jgi:hypothetical protein
MVKLSYPHFFALVVQGGVFLLISSCTLHRLDVQTQYFNHEYLASSHVETPDPRLHEPMIGQRLLLQWSLCRHEVEGEGVFLYLKVRFRNHEEQEIKIPVTSQRGTYLYEIANEAYNQSGGILTYYAEIRHPSGILASWKHPLWANLIQFNFSNSETNS